MSIERIGTTARLSQAVRAGGLVFLTGQVADDVSADIGGQTRQVLAAIDRLLSAVGSDRSRLLSATIFLPDLADFDAMNREWEAWLPPAAAPARTTIPSRLLRPEFRVEIQVVALAG